jgi:hypothetical protein
LSALSWLRFGHSFQSPFAQSLSFRFLPFISVFVHFPAFVLTFAPSALHGRKWQALFLFVPAASGAARTERARGVLHKAAMAAAATEGGKK